MRGDQGSATGANPACGRFSSHLVRLIWDYCGFRTSPPTPIWNDATSRLHLRPSGRAFRDWSRRPLEKDLEAARATGDAEQRRKVFVEQAATADSAWSCLSVGSQLCDLGLLREALDACERAVALDPGNSVAWGHKGLYLRWLGRPKAAIAALDRAIELDATSPATWNNKGVALIDTGRPVDSLAAFDAQPSLIPSTPILGVTRRLRPCGDWSLPGCPAGS